MKRVIFLLIFAFFCSNVLYAQKEHNKASAIKIEADSAKHFGSENKVLFNGNVVAISDNFTLTSDKMTVILNKERDFDKIVCEGNVHFKSGDMISISDKAEIDQRISYAVLISNVKVWQKDNFISGDKMHIYYDEDRIEVDKSEKKRVQLIFTSESEDTSKKKDNKSDNIVTPIKRPVIKEPKIADVPKEPEINLNRKKNAEREGGKK